MKRRRALIVGDPSPLTRSLAALLRVRRIEVVEPPADTSDFEMLARALIHGRVDTVVHTGLIRWGRRLDADVIGTMRLAAALAHPDSAVRTVTAASSAAAYRSSSRAPAVRRESEDLHAAAGTLAARIIEAEGYLRNMSVSNPHINVSILRFADLAATSPGGPLAELLQATVVPILAGFNPSIQLLHLDDAAAALNHAVDRGLAGVYNVAGAQTIRWRDAAQQTKRAATFPAIGPWASVLLRPRRMPAITTDTADVLRFGRCIDTALIAGTGFRSRHTTVDCATATTRQP